MFQVSGFTFQVSSSRMENDAFWEGHKKKQNEPQMEQEIDQKGLQKELNRAPQKLKTLLFSLCFRSK